MIREILGSTADHAAHTERFRQFLKWALLCGVAIGLLYSVIFAVNVLIITTASVTFLLICFLLWQFSSRLNEALAQAQATNVEFQSALLKVEETVAAQTRLLEENEQQRSTIHALSVPMLPINRTVLLLPLIGALDTRRLQIVQDEVLQAIYQSPARILILDVTGLTVVDTHVAQGLLRLAQAAQLLGVEIALVGIRAEVASMLVGLGTSFTGIATYQDLGVALTRILVVPTFTYHEGYVN